MKQAIIDIGSNSVRLMLWADGKSLYKQVNTTRLGEGLQASGALSSCAMERTVLAVAEFCRKARGEGAVIHAFATAAVRKSRNGGEFCRLIRNNCGAEVDVVSGEEEALLALCGALGEEDGGIIDIGGASTEICLREAGKIVFSESFDIGAVRLFDACGQDRGRLLYKIGRRIPSLPAAKGKVCAVGGTASTAASLLLELEAYDAEKIQDYFMSRVRLGALAERLLSLPVEARRALKGMDKPRADIIAGGVLLLEKAASALSLAGVYASDRDNLEGYCALRGLK